MTKRRSLLSALILAVPGILTAQSTGAILGGVQDTSGAVVPSAEVVITSEGTGQKFRSVADEAGRFNFPRLPVGSYKLEVSHPGFKRFVSEQIRLDADQSRLANVSLQIGEATEAITVSGSVGLVDTVGGTLRETVDERRITELPLNGRNPLQLQLLVPGVVPASGGSTLTLNSGISVNGARGTQNNYMLDGGDNNDPLTNTASIVPNPDALEEFSILTNNFSAEYGRNSGAVVNAITKSGTNQFHGSLFEFVRNDAFDARNFFSLTQPKLRRNQFGGSVGGPVLLPGLYNGRDKTFFFVAYESTRERRADTVSNLIVPTALEREGDFSQSSRQPRDPVTSANFPGNVIPAGRIDPAAKKFLDIFIPLPNAAGGLHIFNPNEQLNTNQIITRVDHLLTPSQRLSGRFFSDWNSQENAWALPILRSSSSFHTTNTSANHTWTLTPALLNTAQVTLGRVDLARTPLPVGDNVTYQKLGVRVNSDTPNLPANWRGGVTGFWNMNQDNYVTIDRQTYQVTDTLSWTRGAHSLKFGGEYRFVSNNRETANLTDPQFTFDGRFTNNPFADFLLGRPSRMNQGSLRTNIARSVSWSAFAQDDWKILQNLTLSFGLRYEPFFPFYDADGRVSIFRPGSQSTFYPQAPSGLLYFGDRDVPRGGVGTDGNNLGPRVSFAWSSFRDTKTSVRGAYGIFYETPNFLQLTFFANTQPFSTQVQLNQPASFSDPYAGQVNPFPYTPPVTSDARKNYQYYLPVVVGESVSSNVKAAYMQQWNVNIQRQTASGIVASAAYVGSKGTGLPLQRELNVAPYRAGATLANVDSRRIYGPAFGSIASYEPLGFSTYHALQLTANKRFSRGYSILANYTFGKSIDNGSVDTLGGGQNHADWGPEKALSDFDTRHRFVASFLWELPAPSKGPLHLLIGGWQSNGISTVQSGRPFNVLSGQDRALVGVGQQRPNLVGDPHLDTARSRGALIDRYFDPSAYALPAVGQFGNSGRNTLGGPGSYNVDASLFRVFRLRERKSLQFRSEFFNVLNHANLSNPVANIGSLTVGRILTASSPRILQLGLRLVF